MSTNGLNCTAAQDLLIKKDLERLAENENFSLTEHLQYCNRCVTFQNALVNIHHFIHTSAQEGLVPNPVIRQHIRNKIGAAQPQRHTSAGLSEIWHSIREVLNFRIPLYQAVLGMAVAVAMFIAIDKLNARGDGEALKQPQITRDEKQMIISPATVNHIAKIDSQRIGRTVADDSLLMKFIVTASGENI